MDKRKMWHGDTFTTKQRNAKFAKTFHRQNKPVYSKLSWHKIKKQLLLAEIAETVSLGSQFLYFTAA